MIDDPNIEHEDKPEYDEDGNQIWYMPVLPDMDEFTPYNFNNAPENIPDGYYESVWSNGISSTYTKARTTEEKLTDPVEVIIENTNTNYKDEQGQLNALETKYNEAANKIVTILTNVLAKGKITGEDNAEFLSAQHELTMYSGKIKDLCDIQTKDKEIKSANEIKSKFQNSTADEILDLLTDGGTKPWLYKDSDNNVLVDSQSIPELTVLVNKLNLIATGGDEASEIQLTPEFIKLVSSNINITAENITLEGLVTANENFKILEDGSMMAKNGYFTGQIFVGDGSVIGDAALSDTIRNGANNGTLAIQKLNVVDVDIENLKANKADITDLHATNAEIDNLKANKADIEYLDANYATIQNLNATNANITDLQAIKADITDLNAAKADINVLNSNVADITTLVNGNLTSDNIQSMVITGDKFTVANGFIKNAMIDSVSANKINAGVINTNNVSIQSNDGSMLLQGNLQQFKDKNGKVRIQIGKDAKGNFTFCLYDENGTGQLINEKGIQSSNAIADGLIVDAKVAENANIAGSKLDIDSVVTEVNNGSTSIKGTRIYLDGQKQSLDVAFNNMTTTVKGNTDTLNTHTTSINTMDGKVTQLISDTTITQQDGTTTSLKDAYNATVDTVNSHTQTIGSLETNLSKVSTGQNKWLLEMFEKGNGIDAESPITIEHIVGKPLIKAVLVDDSVTNNQSHFGDNYLGRATTYVYLDEEFNWETTATSDDGSTIYINGAVIATLETCTPATVTVPFKQGWNKITWVYNEGIGGDGWDFNPRLTSIPQIKYMNAYPMTNIDEVGNILDGNIKIVSSKQATLEQNLDGFKQTVSNTYATTQSTSALLKESITEYYLSTSNTTLSGGAWGTTPYTPTPGKYIWQRTKSVTNAGDIKYSNPICVSDEMYTVILKNETLLLKCNSDGEVI